jgi:hypothetical protein
VDDRPNLRAINSRADRLREAGDRLEKDPDRRVQEAITLVSDKVVELGSAWQALLWLHEHGLDLASRRTTDEVEQRFL